MSVKPRVPRKYFPNTCVRQDHNPKRRLASHVVQVRSKRQCDVQRQLGHYERTRAEMLQDLHQAVLNTGGE